MLDHALRFCNELQHLMSQIVIGNRVSQAEIEKYAPGLLEHKQGAFRAANLLHSAIEAEIFRVGPLIAKLEGTLLTDLS
jgi:hypothetical protein